MVGAFWGIFLFLHGKDSQDWCCTFAIPLTSPSHVERGCDGWSHSSRLTITRVRLSDAPDIIRSSVGLVVFVCFPGVNTPTMADFKLPTCHPVQKERKAGIHQMINTNTVQA